MRSYHGTSTAETDRDRWSTPQSLVNGVARKLGISFSLDAAAEGHNKKCPLYIGPNLNTLSVDWSDFMQLMGCASNWAWCNPPFSQMSSFSSHILSQKCNVAMITNASTDTAWWHDLEAEADWVWIIKGRVQFTSNATGKKVNGNNMGQTIFIFDGVQRANKIITVKRDELCSK